MVAGPGSHRVAMHLRTNGEKAFTTRRWWTFIFSPNCGHTHKLRELHKVHQCVTGINTTSPHTGWRAQDVPCHHHGDGLTHFLQSVTVTGGTLYTWPAGGSNTPERTVQRGQDTWFKTNRDVIHWFDGRHLGFLKPGIPYLKERVEPERRRGGSNWRKTETRVKSLTFCGLIHSYMKRVCSWLTSLKMSIKHLWNVSSPLNEKLLRRKRDGSLAFRPLLWMIINGAAFQNCSNACWVRRQGSPSITTDIGIYLVSSTQSSIQSGRCRGGQGNTERWWWGSWTHSSINWLTEKLINRSRDHSEDFRGQTVERRWRWPDIGLFRFKLTWSDTNFNSINLINHIIRNNWL